MNYLANSTNYVVLTSKHTYLLVVVPWAPGDVRSSHGWPVSSVILLFLPLVSHLDRCFGFRDIYSKLRDWAKLLASDCLLPRLKSLVGRAAPIFRIKFVS